MLDAGLYAEQPFPYDLESHPIDVHSVSARKALFMDESAHDWRLVKLGRELGWTGVALKTCKTQTGALLSLCWARAHGMTLMVQDLTNPMLAQIPHVRLLPNAATLSAICIVFPDGSGGNFTEADSACERVTPAATDRAWRALRPPQGRTMVLAAPEVHLDTRRRLLERGRSVNAFNVASLVTAEIAPALRQGWPDRVDLLALNHDEAAALARRPASAGPRAIAEACARRLARSHPGLRLAGTVGPDGAFGACDGAVRHLPALPARVVNTAGAGDAFVAGVMLGEILGLPFMDGEATSLHLGCALGSLKVTGVHTIHGGVELASLRRFLRWNGHGTLLRALAKRQGG